MSRLLPFHLRLRNCLGCVVLLAVVGFFSLGNSVSLCTINACAYAQDEYDGGDAEDVDDEDIPVDAGVFYVRITGDDANSGMSPAEAFRTISRAASMAPAGSIIYVGAGTYSDSPQFVGITATSTQPSRLIADTNGSATGDSGNVIIGPGASLKVLGCANIRVRGFTFQGPTSRCFTWRRSSGGLIEKCTFIGGTDGVKIRSGDVAFMDCTIRDFTNHGIEVFGTAELAMTDCVIQRNGQSGLRVNEFAQVSLESSEFLDNVADGLTVESFTSTDDGVFGFSPNDLLKQARDLLESTLGTVGKKKGQDKIEDSLKEFDKALEPDIWADAWHPSDKDVFEKTKKALDKLKDFWKNDPKKDEELGNNPTTKSNINQVTAWVLEALNRLAMIAIEEAVLGGGDPKEIENAQNELKKVYKEMDKGHFHHAAGKYKKVWEKAIKAGGNAQGTLGWDTNGDNDNPPDALANRKLKISGSSFLSNAFGIRFVTGQTFAMRASDLSQNSSWGIVLVAGGHVEDCTISNNGTGGVWLKNSSGADRTIKDLTIANNTQYGVYAENSDLALDNTNIGDWAISGGQVVVAAVASDVTFENLTMSGGSTAAVQVTRGNLKAANATFSGSGYGLAVDDSNVWLANCTFVANSVGLYATGNDSLSVSDSIFTANTLWGASVAPSGNAGETATFSACTIHNNAGGLSLSGAANGDVLLRDATVIRDNTAAGLHFENCNLTVNDQAGGANWSTVRNLYGISSNQSTLALSQLTVQDSTSYGVRCQSSTVSLSGCRVTGPYGVYTDTSNNSLTLAATEFDSGATPGWGVVRYGGTLDVTNTTLDGFWLGVYLYSPSGSDQATLLNTTIANSTGFGIYLYNGDTVVQNTILTGDGTGYGLVRIGGSATHTHNLIHGFSTPYYGTSADATEVNKDPRFVDAAGGDFHLDVGSPAINAGLDVGLLVPTDMEGNARPSYKRYEIGAYEYMSPNGSFRVLDWTETR